MIVGLASPRPASSLQDGLERVDRLLSEASAQGAEIVCFPEDGAWGIRAAVPDGAGYGSLDDPALRYVVALRDELSRGLR